MLLEKFKARFKIRKISAALPDRGRRGSEGKAGTFARLFALVLGAALLSLSSSAWASEAEEARVLYQKGNAAFRSGDDVMARHYYLTSLEKEDSFDTICNLGRTEARMKRTEEAYYHLALCVELYPKDKELAAAREQFVALGAEVKQELSEQQSSALDTAVAAELVRRKEVAETKAPDSGLEEPVEAEVAPEKNKWKWPVVISVGAVGVASAVAGGVLLGKAAGLRKDGDSASESLGPSGCVDITLSDCEDLESLRERSDSKQHAGVAFAAAGGAFLVGAVILALVVPNERAPQSGAKHRVVVANPTLSVEPHGGFQLGFKGQF